MIKKIFVVTAIGFVLYSCANEKKKEAGDAQKQITIDSTLITDSSWGLITAKTDFQELKKIFGEANILDERICGPECADSVDVTQLYKGTNKQITVYWKDTAYHKTIDMLETFETGSPYHTAANLKIGTSMLEILKENGKPIKFLGFGWDYGGSIADFNKGKLDSSNIKFRLDLVGETVDNSLLGEIELDTEMPNVKANLDKMRIFQIYLFLNYQ